MKLQLLSDLHLEVHPNFVPQAAPDADVLVLAGDIGSYQPGSLLQGEYFGLERFANWPCPVIFVPGNHEYGAQRVASAFSAFATFHESACRKDVQSKSRRAGQIGRASCRERV